MENGWRKFEDNEVRKKKIILVLIYEYEKDNGELGKKLVRNGDGVKEIELNVEDID